MSDPVGVIARETEDSSLNKSPLDVHPVSPTSTRSRHPIFISLDPSPLSPLPTPLPSPLPSLTLPCRYLPSPPFLSDVVELTDDAHRFLFTVAQAASDAVCGFLPASSSSPVQSTLALPRPPLPDDGEATGPHTRTLINALPPTVTIQMVDMAAIPAEGIKPEFMEAFNQIYPQPPGMGPPPPAMGLPPLIASNSVPPLVHPGMPPLMPSLSADSDHFDSLPPLEDCILPDLLGVEEGEGQRAGMQDEEDWDFEAALDYIFDSSRAGGPVSESEWFNTQQRAAYDSAADDDGEMDSPITYFYKDRLQRYVPFLSSPYSLGSCGGGKGWRAAPRLEERR